jgi:hypothetical protein
MLFDEVAERLGALSPAARKEAAPLFKMAASLKWVPSDGPQTQAYLSPADVLLFGGQGGGGKTDLGLGLAFMEHQRSLIIRRKYANLSGLTERAIEINGSRDGFNGSSPPLLRTPDGRYIQFAGNQHLGDEQDWQGIPFDLKVFDEAVQLLEGMVRFHLGWLRATDRTQRVRALLATNPPLDATGDWIIPMFRPWLDITHPRPALPGELRWFVTAPDGEDIEVDGPEPVEFQSGQPSIPMSRSFIPSALRDNPYLINTGYQAKLDGLPEPLRSAVRDGNFMAARQDAEFQVIPTQWVIESQARWRDDGWRDVPMSCMAVDPAGGGPDAEVIGWRHKGWVARLVDKVDTSTADGDVTAAGVVQNRRNGAPVVVDVGGGYGGGLIVLLTENKVPYERFNGAEASLDLSADGSTLPFVNRRASAWWRVREALNPDQDGGAQLTLPPDPELTADLTAPIYKITTRGIQIESKDDLRKRLGRSTGKGDVVAMLVGPGNLLMHRVMASTTAVPRVIQSREAARRRH